MLFIVRIHQREMGHAFKCDARATRENRCQTRITRSGQMKAIVKRFVRDDSGATAIEYGLIAAGISVVIIAAVQALGVNLTGTFNTVAGALK